MDYLHLFETNTQYNSAKDGFDFPSVSRILNNNEIKFGTKPNYSEKYLTLRPLENGVFTLSIPSSVTSSQATSVSYSTDSGTTWVTTQVDNTDQTIEVTANYGTLVLWKGIGIKLGSVKFSSTGKFSVEGNIMSLLEGDNFENANAFSNNYNFMGLFGGCNKLVSAENLILPAFTATGCYYGMFNNCTSLIKVPELPAITMTVNCYTNMFYGCTSLVKAPFLPATTLATGCYNGMFNGCTNLNYIEAMFTTTPGVSYTDNWVRGVAAIGTFVKNGAAMWSLIDDDGIPTGWTTKIQWSDMSESNYFTTEAIETCTFTLTIGSDISTTNLNYIEYSIDGGSNWIKTVNVDSQTVTITTPSISAGDSVKWRGAADCLAISDDNGQYSKFRSTGQYSISGDIRTLTAGSTYSTSFMYTGLFNGSNNLVSAENLELLVNNLPARCYSKMFYGCTALTTAPSLPSTLLNDYCYAYMFQGCTSLVNIPSVLPATILSNFCYSRMFYGCTSLVKAPKLPATTLVSYCYNEMFYGCTNLNYVKALFTTTPSNNYTSSWLANVAPTGTFVKDFLTTWDVTGINGVPTGWIAEKDYSEQYLTFVPLESGTFTFHVDARANNFDQVTVAYRTRNGNSWSSWTSASKANDSESDINLTTPTLSAGQLVQWRGNIEYTSVKNYGQPFVGDMSYFESTGTFNVCGRLASLTWGDNYLNNNTLYDSGQNNSFPCLFAPSYNFSSGSYTGTGAQVVNAKDLVMFDNVRQGCYGYMFAGCTTLLTAPDLLTPTLTSYCYINMFDGCTNLTNIKMIATSVSETGCLTNWVRNVAASGTFTKHPDTTLSTGNSGIPSGWTVATATE